MISLIVCHANQNVIGFKNRMPWHLPADLQHVKETTAGHTLVMGRKTFESIGRPLPKRKNVILTNNRNFNSIHDNIEIMHDTDDIKTLPGKVFIFGGSGIYQQTMHMVDEMYITRIFETFGGDTFFPEYDLADWEVVSREEGVVDNTNKYPHEFLHLVRKNN
ncbi:dihydrofolate reductase [Salinicoccus albus]|uniref:dihydrofolate reductase n=1 Tax=Salinicoccus albus TaxID=418756 RepID=UPI00037EDE7B|nr:dihydrofolate reductase [Salinicoccus albus]